MRTQLKATTYTLTVINAVILSVFCSSVSAEAFLPIDEAQSRQLRTTEELIERVSQMEFQLEDMRHQSERVRQENSRTQKKQAQADKENAKNEKVQDYSMQRALESLYDDLGKINNMHVVKFEGKTHLMSAEQYRQFTEQQEMVASLHVLGNPALSIINSFSSESSDENDEVSESNSEKLNIYSSHKKTPSQDTASARTDAQNKALEQTQNQLNERRARALEREKEREKARSRTSSYGSN